MDLAALVDERIVSFGLDVTDKDDAIKKITHMLFEAGKVNDEGQYISGIHKREGEFNTGIGNGIAIPHCLGACVNETAFALVKLNQNIEWGSLDDKPVNYIIMLAVPQGEASVHLNLLANLSRKLIDTEYQEKLKNAKTLSEIKRVLD